MSYSSGICVLMGRATKIPPPVWPNQGSSGLSGCYKWTQEDILEWTPDNLSFVCTVSKECQQGQFCFEFELCVYAMRVFVLYKEKHS